MSNNNETPKPLKVLRVNDLSHQTAKINAVKRGEKLQTYLEKLIAADEQGLVDWSKLV